MPELHGLDRFEARKKAAEMLEESGLLAKDEPYENNVASAIAAMCRSSRG